MRKGGYKLEKQYRLPGYDYASDGAYFVTICTKDRKEFLTCRGLKF